MGRKLTWPASSRACLIRIAGLIEWEVVRSLEIAKQYEAACLDLNTLLDDVQLYKRQILESLENIKMFLRAEDDLVNPTPVETPKTNEIVPEVIVEESEASNNRNTSTNVDAAWSDSMRAMSLGSNRFSLPRISILSNRSLNLELYDGTDHSARNSKAHAEEDRTRDSHTSYIPTKLPLANLYTDDAPAAPEQCPALQVDDSSERSSWGSSADQHHPPSPPSPLPYPEGKSHFSDVSDTEDSTPPAGGRRASILHSDFVQERLRIKKARTTLKAIRPASTRTAPAGLCKGALRIRDDPRTGLGLAKTPTGLYTSALRWQCRSCWFSGGVYGRAKALKHDQRVYTDDATGITYRWMFLAKSHVARKQSSVSENVGDRFGCVFCVDEGRETGVFDGPAALMGHIATEHRNLDEGLAARNKCVAGDGLPAAEWEIRVC
jgi:hypothetical protein